MVDVVVSFSFLQREWTHAFHVDKGSTVLNLKELMLKSRGQEADFASFELRRAGQRTALPDAEALWQDERLEFRFLSERRRARRAERAAKRELAAQDRVEVVLRHAQVEKESSLTIRVSADATLGEVRREAMAVLGETRLSELRLVARQGRSFASLPDGESLNARRELLTLGRKLEGAPQLTMETATRLQLDLLAGFSAEEFQRELLAAEKEHGRESRRFMAKRQALTLAVQKEVLPRYGFEGTPKGVMQMMSAMQPYGPALVEAGQRIDVLLRNRDPPGAEQPAPAAEGGPTGELTVVVQWDVNDPSKEAAMSLPRTCTMAQVKQALCAGDPSGASRPEYFFMARELAPDVPLDDGLAISEGQGKLKLVPWAMGPK
mmetsp:Transcript_111160/g.346446  ORF Transcript_111160/g.346446 Transcript_111160/m.346446 type:complete len:377 (+) Transcript_111160:77-1207(+)